MAKVVVVKVVVVKVVVEMVVKPEAAEVAKEGGAGPRAVTMAEWADSASR